MKKKKKKENAKSDDFGKPVRLSRRRTISCSDFQDCFQPARQDRDRVRATRVQVSRTPLLYWSFKCNIKLFHLQRCFSTQYKIPHHLSPPANQSTSSRSRRNKASPSPTAPTTHPPIYNVVSRPFAIHLVTNPATAALRPSLVKIKRYRTTLFIFNKREFWNAYGDITDLFLHP